MAAHAGAVLIDGGHGIAQKRGYVIDVGDTQTYEGKDAELGRETPVGLGFEFVPGGKKGIEVLNEVGMDVCDLMSQDRVYADPNSVLTFLANHDTNRFQRTEEEAQNITRYKQALALLLTLRGIPQLYYGDEIGMYANKSVNDGALRQMFPEAAFRAEGRTALQQEYFDYTKRLLNWRKGNEAIARGRMVHFTVRNGVYVYARIWKAAVSVRLLRVILQLICAFCFHFDIHQHPENAIKSIVVDRHRKICASQRVKKWHPKDTKHQIFL